MKELFSLKKKIFLKMKVKYSKTVTAHKVSKYGVFTGPYFPVFGLNIEIYSVNLRIQENRNHIKLLIWTLFLQRVF